MARSTFAGYAGAAAADVRSTDARPVDLGYSDDVYAGPSVYPGQDNQPSTMADSYDPGYPNAVAAPEWHEVTVQDDYGQSARPDIQPTVALTYIDQNVGGTTGVVNRNGYTSGINVTWNAHRFTGRAVKFVRRDLAADTGPVGRINYGGYRDAGVEQQFTVPPTLEDIYRSLVSGR